MRPSARLEEGSVSRKVRYARGRQVLMDGMEARSPGAASVSRPARCEKGAAGAACGSQEGTNRKQAPAPAPEKLCQSNDPAASPSDSAPLWVPQWVRSWKLSP